MLHEVVKKYYKGVYDICMGDVWNNNAEIFIRIII
jgi:hypothetical protein